VAGFSGYSRKRFAQGHQQQLRGKKPSELQTLYVISSGTIVSKEIPRAVVLVVPVPQQEERRSP
jgi:hypothetical protein